MWQARFGRGILGTEHVERQYTVFDWPLSTHSPSQHRL
jgi:hypothetical protein